ncbi:glycerol kinase protein [Rutstroemia sp. NJR-2017a BBW]|nr:glycerol kinase protein [Rutstroemia sp. NJR-2017a BBW]
MGDTMVRSNESFIGSIDQGTTSTRFLIFNKDGEPVASHQVEFSQIYPQSGIIVLTKLRWHEHDPLEIIESIETCIDGAVKQFEEQGHSARNIEAIGLTNQRETTVVWDHETGEPLANAIVWTDARTQSLVRKLKARLGSGELQGLCGLPLSTYPAVGKLLWLIENNGKTADAYARGQLAFGTIDAWVVYKLNGGPKNNVFVTDPTNASRTMLMNLHTLKYDESLLDFFRFDMDKLHLPKIVRSSDREAFGMLTSGVLKGVPITGVLGDQSAALVGQKGFTPGRAKNTYGTGCFLLYHVGDKPVISKHGLLSTVAYDFDGHPQYALEGSIAVAGSSIKFLQNNLGFIDSSSKVSQLAETVDDNGGCVFVTAFSGLFAPYWIDDARGTLCKTNSPKPEGVADQDLVGITAYTQKGHIARATLEATCFQTKAILDAMEKDSGKKLAELAVDGGMCNSDLCMQTQADLISIPVERPRMLETTALGAAIAAGFAVGVWKTFEELKNVNTAGVTTFNPQIAREESEEKFSRWSKAVEMCRGWL